MRLYKKAAAVLLAAAMAVSMMTACGGGAGGGPGVVEGVTYTSTADLVAGVNEDSITSRKPITMAESKYAAFMKMASNPKAYVKLSMANVVDGELTNRADAEVAQTEKYSYSKTSYGDQTMEMLEEKATNGVYEYTFVDASDGKAAVRFFQKVDSPETPDVPGTSGTPSVQVTISSAKVTVNGTLYDAEIIQSGGAQRIMCYEKGKPVPTYDFQSNPYGKSVTVYKTICFGTDKGTIANRLSGYTVYTVTPEGNSKTKGTLKNEATGVTYDVEITGENTYTVKKGGVPTTEIDWLIKGILKAFKKS